MREQNAARGVASASLFSSTWVKVRGLGFWVAVNFFITLSVFPAVTADVQTYSFPRQPAMWIGLYCFLLFNVGDWSGRLLAGWARIADGHALRLLITCRVGFLPLFMLCNHTKTRLPIVFEHDAFPVAFMFLFALSNGYAGTICMMTAPSLVSDAAGMQAGTIMASCLVLGIVLGTSQARKVCPKLPACLSCCPAVVTPQVARFRLRSSSRILVLTHSAPPANWECWKWQLRGPVPSPQTLQRVTRLCDLASRWPTAVYGRDTFMHHLDG